MSAKFISSTPIWRFLECSQRRGQRTRGEKSTCGRITIYLIRGGAINMERLNSMTEKEIMAIPGIQKASYRYIQEALDDFRAEYGNLTWEMPDFDGAEIRYILNEMMFRKLTRYCDLVLDFLGMAQDEYQHPYMEVMEQIYYKLSSIDRDEFAAIMDAKGINLANYGL